MLLEKFEKKAKRVMELQDQLEHASLNVDNYTDLRKEFQEQISGLEEVNKEQQVKMDSLQKQVKASRYELYQAQQREQNLTTQL